VHESYYIIHIAGHVVTFCDKKQFSFLGNLPDLMSA